MLGYCGIDCSACSAYQGTVATRIDLLEKVAGSDLKGANKAQEWVCLGCTPADQGFLAKYCETCGIRACAIERGVQNCAACSEFAACDRVQTFIGGESKEVAQRMTWLCERFKALHVIPPGARAAAVE
jgi:hypothetical protein